MAVLHRRAARNARCASCKGGNTRSGSLQACAPAAALGTVFYFGDNISSSIFSNSLGVCVFDFWSLRT